MKLDLGCGPNKAEGYVGVDIIDFEGVDKVFDIGALNWPLEDGSVDEARACHVLEHLTPVQRMNFFNELHRVLKVGGRCEIITPHWASGRAYGDMTHQWPPVSEFFYFYLDKKWRAENAPHVDAKYHPAGFSCDFEATWGYGIHHTIAGRNDEFQQFAINFYKEAAQDLHATVTKKE